MTQNIILGLMLYLVGHIFAWYQFNSQFVFEWARINILLPVIILAVPMGFCFMYGTKLIMTDTNELWTARLLGFGISYAVFPIMTWFYLNESMFTTKTMVCCLLACIIMYIQLFWK